MRVLLDTNILLWSIGETDILDPRAAALIEDQSNVVLFSTASIWEIAIKAGLKRDNFNASPELVLAGALASGFIELPVLSTVASKVAYLPHHHRDPFDRLLIAQAMAEAAILLTSDQILSRYTDLVTVVHGRPSRSSALD